MNRSLANHDSAHWQARGDEARLKASQSADPELKTVLLEVALAYERLAQIVAKPHHSRNGASSGANVRGAFCSRCEVWPSYQATHLLWYSRCKNKREVRAAARLPSAPRQHTGLARAVVLTVINR
jgi:hypothetical protein